MIFERIAGFYPATPQTRIRSSQLIMDVLVPLTRYPTTFQARVAVVELTKLIRHKPKEPWSALSTAYLCGTDYGVFVKGISFPFRVLAHRRYEGLSNPYEAANQYARFLGTQVDPLIARHESVKVFYLATTRPHSPPSKA